MTRYYLFLKRNGLLFEQCRIPRKCYFIDNAKMLKLSQWVWKKMIFSWSLLNVLVTV